MYIVLTNESLFDKEDIYEGLEYASSVFRLLWANKEFEFDEKQSQNGFG